MEFNDDSKPIYRQIVDRISDDIMAGIYKADDRVPSVREYAASIEVNANTVMRAYDSLQQSQIIYNKRGIGYFVSQDAKERIKKEKYEKFICNDINQLFKQLELLEITPEDLTTLYTNYLKK